MKWKMSWQLLRYPMIILVACTLSGCLIKEQYIFSPNKNWSCTAELESLNYENVSFSAEDGTHLHGWYIQGEPDKPLVFFFHGTSTNLSQQVRNLLILQQMGVSVFAFDYRGYGKSEGVPTEEGTYQDARGGLTYLHSRGWKADKTIYFGRSLGAAVALQLALENPPAGLVLECPFTSIGRLISHHHPFSFSLVRWSFQDHYDNLAKIGRLNVPLLIFQGDQDTIVPPEMAKVLFKKAKPPKKLHIINGANHINIYQIGGKAYWQSWLRFIQGKRDPVL